MPFKPYSDNVLVRRHPEGEAEKHGLRIPDSAKEKPDVGTVVAVGPGFRTDSGAIIPISCKAGDVVLFRKFAGGAGVRIDGEDLLLMHEQEILGELVTE